MKLEEATDLCAYIAREYAAGFFRLLTNYEDLSAKEAASWMGVQVSEAEDFLNGLAEHGVLEKKIVKEREVVQARYILRRRKLQISMDLSSEYKHIPDVGKDRQVRRRDSASSEFVLTKTGDRYRSVTIWKGMGRGRVNREIWLTPAQGRFLFNMPIAGSDAITIQKAIEKAKVGKEREMEILMLVEELAQLNVIQVI